MKPTKIVLIKGITTAKIDNIEIKNKCQKFYNDICINMNVNRINVVM